MIPRCATVIDELDQGEAVVARRAGGATGTSCAHRHRRVARPAQDDGELLVGPAVAARDGDRDLLDAGVVAGAAPGRRRRQAAPAARPPGSPVNPAGSSPAKPTVAGDVGVGRGAGDVVAGCRRDVPLDRLGVAAGVGAAGGLLAVDVGRLDAQLRGRRGSPPPATPRMTTATSTSTRVSPRSSRTSACDGTARQTCTWLKMPYIAETSAMATKPTIRPMTMMTSGSNSAVSFAIL